jgi:D-sedoheptulose 7-phosphate isomerase
MAISLSKNVAVIADQLFERHDELKSTRSALVDSFAAIVDTFENHGILYICGNGGSFADAVHIKGELAKSFETPRPIADPGVLARLGQLDVGPALI